MLWGLSVDNWKYCYTLAPIVDAGLIRPFLTGTWSRYMIGAQAAFMRVERMRQRTPVVVGIAATSFLLSLWLRFFFDSSLPTGFPFLTFFPAVILTTVLVGTKPGIVVAVLSLFSAWYWFIPPFGSFQFDHKVMWALGFFAVIAGVDIFIIHWMRRALLALASERENTAKLATEQTRLAEQQRQLFQELQHRVSNNFQIVASLLSIQERKLKDVPPAATALRDARARLDLMSRVHRRLYLSSTDGVVLPDYLQLLCHEIMQAGNASRVALKVDADALPLSVDQLTNLSLIALEAITNATKYGLAGSADAELKVSVKAMDADNVRFAIADNGPGFPPDFDPLQSRQLGFKLIRGFASSLRGTVDFRNDNGAVVEVVFPLKALS